MVKDLYPGASDSNPYDMTAVPATGGLVPQPAELFFFATGLDNNNNEVVKLWVSDGTSRGTKSLMTFNLDNGAAPNFETAAFNGKFYFTVDGPNNLKNLWVSDGTTTTTVKASNGNEVTVPAGTPMYPVAAGDWLYFAASTPKNGVQLWRTDGTQQQTRLFSVINPKGDSTPDVMGLVGGTYLFVVASGVNDKGAAVGREVFSLNIENQLPPTIQLTGNLNLNGDSEISGFAQAGGYAYFVANGTLYSFKPTTNVLSEIDDTGTSITSLTVSGSSLFWFAKDDNLDWKLYTTTTDRDDASIVKDKNGDDVNPDPAKSIAAINENGAQRIVFAATTNDKGTEPWVSDGTNAGTWMIADVLPNATSSNPSFFTYRAGLQAPPVLYFVASNGDGQRQLYYSNGRENGGAKLVPGEAGVPYSVTGVISPSLVTLVGDKVFFTATDGQHGVELWAINFDNNLKAQTVQPQDDYYATLPGQTLNVSAADGVLSNDSDLDQNTLTASLATAPQHGTVTLNSDGSFSYIPTSGFTGTDQFTYIASDGTYAGDPATVTISVTDVPVANAQAYEVDSNNTLTVAAPGLLASAVDPQGSALTISSYTQPSHGTVSVNSDGSFVYTPNSNYAGDDSFTFAVSNGTDVSDSATVSISVVNQLPQSLDDSYTTLPGQTLTATAAEGVLANDHDLDGDALTANLGTGPQHGILTLNSDGSFSYAPDTGYTGLDSFSYSASDGIADGNTVDVTINVTAAPTGVSATAASYNEIDLAFTLPDGASSGNVYRSTSPDSGFTKIATDVSSGYHDTGLSASTQYYYYVTANIDSGESLASTTVDETTWSDAPTDVSATSASSSEIDVAFTLPEGASSGNVYRSTSPDSGFTKVAADVSSDYHDTGLSASTQYYYYVTANIDGVEGEASDNVNATTYVAAPTGVSASVISSTEINIAFTLPTGATTANIYRSTSPTGGFTRIASGVTSSPYHDTSLSSNTQYYYYVAGVDSNGNEGAASSQVNGTTLLAAPTGVTATVISSSEIDLSFSAVSGANSYTIYSSTDGTTWTQLLSGLTSTSYANTGLSADTAVYYYVVAVDGSGQPGDRSSTADATTRVGAPTGVSASVVSSTEIDIAFTLPTGATTADIYRSTSPTGGFTLIASGVTSSPYHDTSLSSNTQYYYYVAGVDSNDNQGAASAQVNGTTLLAAPTGLTATTVSLSEIDLSFGAVSGASSYTIYTSTDGMTWTQLTSGLTTTSYSDTGLTTGTTYYFYIVAVDGSSREGDHSSTANARCVPATFTMTLSGFGGSFTALNGTWTLTEISDSQWEYVSGQFSFEFGDDGTQFYATVIDNSSGDEAIWQAPLSSYNWVGDISSLTFVSSNFPDSNPSISVNADSGQNNPSITYPAPNQDVTSQLYDLWAYGAYGATPYNIVSVTIDGTISASQIDNDISDNFWDAEFLSLTAPPTPTYHTLLVVDTNGGETSTTIWY